jgi:integrase
MSEHTLSGEAQPNTFVFTYSDGRPVHPGTFPSWFRDLVEEAGLPWRKVHGMRHTHAYVLLNNGWALEKVSRRLGHSSTRVTDHYYGHISRSRPPSREVLSFTAALHAARDVGGSAVAARGQTTSG